MTPSDDLSPAAAHAASAQRNAHGPSASGVVAAPGVGADAGALAVAADLWALAGLPSAALRHLRFSGPPVAAPSSFAVTTAVQASLGVAALAAAEAWHRRQADGARQTVSVASDHAVADSLGWFAVDGQVPPAWEKFSGLYPCGHQAPGGPAPGWVRVHANFTHHRDALLALLGLPTDGRAEREDVARALAVWPAEAFEAAAAEAGALVSAARTPQAWAAHPQAQALRGQPVLQLQRLDDGTQPPPWPPAAAASADVPSRLGALSAAEDARAPNASDGRPWSGLRVLDLTRILAGPVAARDLAAHGAEVLMVNGPGLPNIAAIADMGRGKRSCLLDLGSAEGADTLRGLVRGARVFLQGYRPGGLAARGFGADALVRLRPGLVCASLSAYGPAGPWAGRRGFDSLVQTATGLNLAEAAAFGQAEPRALPFQCLDYCAGHLLAFGIQAALLRQADEGGSWQVQVSLAGVGQWLAGLGRPAGGLSATLPDPRAFAETVDSGWGRLTGLRHAAQLSRTPAHWLWPSVPPGTDPPRWG